jgi:hypothetical protein
MYIVILNTGPNIVLNLYYVVAFNLPFGKTITA